MPLPARLPLHARRAAPAPPRPDKPRAHPALAAALLLLPFAGVSLLAADLRGRIFARAHTPAPPDWVRKSRILPVASRPTLSAVGAAPPPPPLPPPPQQQQQLGATPGGQPLVRAHERVVDGAHVFVPDDINNPTKVPVPPDGFPPLSLPDAHRNAQLLASIRARCTMRPRWPDHPGMHALALRSYGPAYSSIIISHKLKVIYVPVFKVGTTTMMWHIAYLENNPFVLRESRGKPGALDLVLHEMDAPAWKNHTIFDRSPRHIRDAFEDPAYLKFGFVRNPFDRIISAYLDKIVRFPIDSREYQTQMHGLYGDDVTMRTDANATKPSFRQFLHAVSRVLQLPRTASTDLWNSSAYEDNTSRRDLHWRPQVELLHPDLIHFDFVGRFENLEQDWQVVLKWMYRHTDRRMPVDAREKLHATKPSDKVALYDMLRLDEELRLLVVDIYRKDFDRFQFSEEVPKT